MLYALKLIEQNTTVPVHLKSSHVELYSQLRRLLAVFKLASHVWPFMH